MNEQQCLVLNTVFGSVVTDPRNGCFHARSGFNIREKVLRSRGRAIEVSGVSRIRMAATEPNRGRVTVVSGN